MKATVPDKIIQDKVQRVILIISDIHMGAGTIYSKRRNYLEDFFYDDELIDFIKFHCEGEYKDKEVELVINGDFLDFLAVPYVSYFDHEYWCEDAAKDKLELIYKGHLGVFEVLGVFLEGKNKKLTYVIGNHDAEMLHPSLQKQFYNYFKEDVRSSIEIVINTHKPYVPQEGIWVMHGHEYEMAHDYEPNEAIVEGENQKKYFIPPWGSYYVINVVNRYKEDRPHINGILPIKTFLINGLIYDTFFTLRFMLTNAYFMLMVRFIDIFKEKRSIIKMIKQSILELDLFNDYETFARKLLNQEEKVKALIVGHTHNATFRPYSNGKVFINTGTWINLHRLDFKNRGHSTVNLTYAQIEVSKKEKNQKDFFEHLDVTLNIWRGRKTSVRKKYHV